MKIMGPYFEGAVGKSSQARRFDVDHIVLVLERTFDQQKLAACDHEPVAVVKVGGDNDVGDARLVLH